MRILRVKNYEKYQNHRSKNPSWIKLYRTLLTDPAFLRLDIESRYLYVGLLILASETNNCIVNDGSYLVQRLAMNGSRLVQESVNGGPELNLTSLFRSGLLLASKSTVKRMKCPSERETERETEKISPLPPLGGTRQRGKVTFPDDLTVTEDEKAQWLKFGINAAVEFASFKDHALTNDRRCADWEAAKRNWFRKAVRMKEERAHVSTMQR